MADLPARFSTFKALIATPEPPFLGPQSRPGTLGLVELERRLADFFKGVRLSASTQSLLRSAALLWHDHLDASHTISQNVETRDGSWLHGIMHRREPDYGNAKYWFRRVGRHEAFPSLAAHVATLLRNDSVGLAERLIQKGDWMPLAFVDECERAEEGGAALGALLRRVQAVEFDTLVEQILTSA